MAVSPVGAAFPQLLQQLHDQHVKEVSQLEKTIVELHCTINEMTHGPGQRTRPRRVEIEACLPQNFEEGPPKNNEEDLERMSMKDAQRLEKTLLDLRYNIGVTTNWSEQLAIAQCEEAWLPQNFQAGPAHNGEDKMFMNDAPSPDKVTLDLGSNIGEETQGRFPQKFEEGLARDIGEGKEQSAGGVSTIGKDHAAPSVIFDDGTQQSQTKTFEHQRSPFEASAEMPRFMVLLDFVIAGCILANIVFMFVRLNYQGYLTAVEIGLEEPGKWPDMGSFFDVTQHLFCLFFLIELLGRLALLKGAYFYSTHWEKFNIFDALLVVFTVVDLYVVDPLLSAQKPGSDLSAIRAVRSIRILRAMRVVRTLDIFSPLRVLLTTVIASFGSLLWSMVLLFLTMLIAALILTQLVNSYFSETRISDDTLRWMFLHYGTASRSLWTFVEITFSGGWPRYARPLVEEVDPIFAWFFALFVPGVIFAMTRIITALFLKDTLAAASNDAEMQIRAKLREKKAYAKKLHAFFKAADSSGDGNMTLEEFESFLTHPSVREYLAVLDLEVHESTSLFHALDDGNGVITAEEFVQSVLRLKGAARSQDVVAIMHEFDIIIRAVERIQRDVGDLRQQRACA